MKRLDKYQMMVVFFSRSFELFIDTRESLWMFSNRTFTQNQNITAHNTQTVIIE